MNPELEGYATAVLGAIDAETVRRAADDLAAVDRLVTDNDVLRTALIDTAVPPLARRAVIEDLLTGRVSDDARRLAAHTVAAVKSQEIPSALTWLAHRARRTAEGTELSVPALSNLGARQRVGGFATALFDELTVAQLEEMEDELFRFGRTIETSPALRGALADRDLPAAVRQGVAGDLLAGKVQPATLRLVDYVVLAGRPRNIVGTMYWLVDRTAEARGWRVARVVAAREVLDTERTALSDTLGRLSGSPVELQVTIDPLLLAGVRVRIGDLQVDATARGRIDQLREHMEAMGGWENRGFGAGGRATNQEGAN